MSGGGAMTPGLSADRDGIRASLLEAAIKYKPGLRRAQAGQSELRIADS
jgi:hypothetical protein